MTRRLTLALLLVLALATPVLAANGALSWQPAANATGYKVEGCTGTCAPTDPAWTVIQANQPATSLAETGLPLNATLCRRITPLNGFGPGPTTAAQCGNTTLPGGISGAIIWSLTP